MATPRSFERAKLEIEGMGPIEVLFNPTEYSISKSNEWKYDKVTGTSFKEPQFTGGNPREISVSLLLDASLLADKTTVRTITDKLFQAMEVSGGQSGGGTKAAPPFIKFNWGTVVTFKAVCTQLTVAFKLFDTNGEPIRADVKMSLKQAEMASTASSNGASRPGNPTTRARAGYGVHRVKDGDTLPSIAYQTYGDATVWRAIAEANEIENPLHLRRGSALSLPKLDG